MDCSESPGKCPWERYHLLGTKRSATLGAGAYGYVRAAWDKKAQKLVAIKIQPSDSDEGAREFMLFQSVPQHPNLLRMHDVFLKGKEVSIVFDYCEMSLYDMWKRAQGFLDWEKTISYGEQILRGLGHLHRNRVAHRDLSQKNVLINDGRCVVADLGLAESASTLVLDRMVTTLFHRAPEACFPEARESTQQCPLDMWSYGVVIAELWTGMHIFAAEKGDDEKDVKPLLRVLVDWLGTPPDDYPYLAEMKRRIPRELAATRPATRTCQIFRGRMASLPIYLA